MRIATISDAKAITALINQAFKVEWFVYGDRVDLEQVRAHFARGEFLVADDDATLTGCVYIEARGKRSYLGLLSVDPSRQRSGLGAKLMSVAEDRCRESGSQFMDILIVNLREELPTFYRRLGYIEDGTAPFPDGVPTKVPCHFVKLSKQL